MSVLIGLEIHCQLNTKSKLFCGCKNDVSEHPNVYCCPTCLGHPGAKPVFNKEVLQKALKVSLALGCRINSHILFSRKNYFFPDLPNNYQTTQYEFPLAEKGKFDGVRITRLHMEEDPGRLIHKPNHVLIDYNRSGTPLIEIVTDPDLHSPEDAKRFLKRLVITLEYLKVYFRSSEATLRCDVNVSLDGGNRVEVKNVNGINDVKRVIEYEMERQKMETAVQETRGWDAEKGITYAMRTKESEDDYGYITDPNLPSFTISKEMIEEMRLTLPELAHKKAERFMKEYRLAPEDAEVLTVEMELADFFERIAREIDPILAARWLKRELVKLLSQQGKKLSEIVLDEKEVKEVLSLFSKKEITDKTAKLLLIQLMEKRFSVKEYIKEHDLGAVSDTDVLEIFCDEVIKEYPQAVEDYKKGAEKALNFLVGQIMKKSRGKATPDICKELLKKRFN